MKKKILNELWLFAKIDLLCYVIYFPATILLALIFYEDVAPGHRDFTPIYWSMHVIFFFAYYIIYSKHIANDKIEMSSDEFSIKKTIINYIKTERLQVILMGIFAVTFEVSMLIYSGPANYVALVTLMFVPSAEAIEIPIIRTLVGFTISMFSILVSYVIINYKKHQYWNTKRK